MSIKLSISACESAASKYHSVVREIASQKADLNSTCGSAKGAWQGDAANEWANRIDIVANQIERGVSDDISSVGDLLDDIAGDAKTLRSKAEALPVSLGGSGDSGGTILVLTDDAAGVKGEATALGEALDSVGPAVEDIRGILSQLTTCSLTVDDAAEAAVSTAKARLEAFTVDWDAYLSGVSSLVHKITSGMSTLDPNGPAMKQGATAKAVANYAKSSGAAGIMSGLSNSNCAYGGDPVNMTTGNFIYPELDLVLGEVSGVTVERMYNSSSSEVGLFGFGWSSTLDECLTFDDALVTHLRPDGRRRVFVPTSDDVWKTIDEVEETIVRRDDSYILDRLDGTSRVFNEGGRLVEVRNVLGVMAVVRRDEAGLPFRLEAGDGRHVEIAYAGPHVTLLRDHAGREVRYAYEGDFLSLVTKPDGATWGYAYDKAGRLCEIIDPLGRQKLRQSYDGRGRITRQQMAGEGEDTFSYTNESTTHESARTGREMFVQDDLGRTIEVRRGTASEHYAYTTRNLWERRLDNTGTRMRWAYTAAGDVNKVELPSGASVDIERDDRRISEVTVAGRRLLSISYENGLPTSVVDGEGNAFKVVWDEGGRDFSVACPDGTQTSIGLNAAYELISLQAPGEGEVRVERDSLGRPTCVLAPSGTTHYSWDAEGRLTSEQTEGGPLRSYTYDARGDLASVVEGEHRLDMERDEAARIVRAELDDGQWVSAAYDEAGRMTFSEDSCGRALACTYDEAGHLRRATDATGVWIEWDYDDAGRVIRASDCLGAAQSIEYGFDGRVRSISDNRRGVISMVRDALGRVIASFDEEGLLFETKRNANGEVVSTTNAVGEVAHFEYNWAGRVVRVKADGMDASVSRDASGRAVGISVSERRGGSILLKERRTYTNGGHLSRIEGPLGTESFKWAGDGSLRSHEDGLGVTTSQVAADGRSVRVTRPDGSVRAASLSHDRRLATIKDGGASAAISFDEHGRPAHADMGGDGTVDYEYDRLGRLLSVAHSQAPKVTYAYDEVGRVTSITQGDMGVRYAYDDAGRIVRREFSDGTSVSYSYDGRDNLASLVVRDADGRETLSEGYAHDRLGRIVARTVARDGARSEFAYSYDRAGRLLAVSENGRERNAWDYDTLGNVLRVSTPHGTTTYSYDTAGRMVRSEGPEGSRCYEWDARSRLSRVTKDGGALALELSWDAADRLVASTNERGTTTYGYDALGNRISQEGPDGSFGWAIDPLRATRNTLAWGCEGDLRPALADGAMPLWSGGSFLVSDANGTPLATTAEPARMLLEDPFGTGSWDDLAFGYAGYTPDPATGLLHSRLRDYDPSARRFCSPDPRRGDVTSPRTLNRWACCFSDPVNLVDVDGGWPDVGKWFSDRVDDVKQWWSDNAGTSVTTTTMSGDYMGSLWGVTPSQTKTVSTGGNRWLYTNITDGKVTGGGVRIPGLASIGWNNGVTVSLLGGDYGGYTAGASAKFGWGQNGLSLDLDFSAGKSDNNGGFGISLGIPQSSVRVFHNTTDDQGVVTHDQWDAHVNTLLVVVVVGLAALGAGALAALAAGTAIPAGVFAGIASPASVLTGAGLLFAIPPSFSSTCDSDRN